MQPQPEHVTSAPSSAAATYLPGPQALHGAGPASALYFPATHFVHGPPSGPEDPALQVQADVDTLAMGESEFIGHASHLPLSRYCPASQSLEHGPPLGPLKPLLHTQLFATLLPGGDIEFAEQLKQTPASFAPVEAEYFPLMQSVHGDAPMTALYFPTEHSTHGPPFGPVEPLLHLQ